MIFVKMERNPLNSATSRWLGDFTFFQYNRSAPSLLWVLFGSWGLKRIMKKISLVLEIAFGAVCFAWSQTTCVQAKTSPLDGTWELAAGSATPQGCT